MHNQSTKQAINQTIKQPTMVNNQPTNNQGMNSIEQKTKQSSNQSTCPATSSNLVNKVDSVTRRMNQQRHQASNASMCDVPSFASSPCFPSDWSTFRVSLLKYTYTDRAHQIGRNVLLTLSPRCELSSSVFCVCTLLRSYRFKFIHTSFRLWIQMLIGQSQLIPLKVLMILVWHCTMVPSSPKFENLTFKFGFNYMRKKTRYGLGGTDSRPHPQNWKCPATRTQRTDQEETTGRPVFEITSCSSVIYSVSVTPKSPMNTNDSFRKCD